MSYYHLKECGPKSLDIIGIKHLFLRPNSRTSVMRWHRCRIVFCNKQRSRQHRNSPRREIPNRMAHGPRGLTIGRHLGYIEAHNSSQAFDYSQYQPYCLRCGVSGLLDALGIAIVTDFPLLAPSVGRKYGHVWKAYALERLSLLGASLQPTVYGRSTHEDHNISRMRSKMVYQTTVSNGLSSKIAVPEIRLSAIMTKSSLTPSGHPPHPFGGPLPLDY